MASALRRQIFGCLFAISILVPLASGPISAQSTLQALVDEACASTEGTPVNGLCWLTADDYDVAQDPPLQYVAGSPPINKPGPPVYCWVIPPWYLDLYYLGESIADGIPEGAGNQIGFVCDSPNAYSNTSNNFQFPVVARGGSPEDYGLVGQTPAGYMDYANVTPHAKYSRFLDDYGVDVVSGEYTFSLEYLKIPGRGLDYSFSMTYRSTPSCGGLSSALGVGWDHLYFSRLMPWFQLDGKTDGIVRLIEGQADLFALDPGNPDIYVEKTEGYNRLAVIRDGDTITKLAVRSPEGKIFWYHPFDGTDLGGKLDAIEDRHGNKIQCVYEPLGTDTYGIDGWRLSQVLDTHDRAITYHYYDTDDLAVGASQYMLESVTDHTGREIRFTYEVPDPVTGSLPVDWPLPSGKGLLLSGVRSPVVSLGPDGSAPYPDGKTVSFQYESHYLAHTLPARGGFSTQTGATVPPVVADILDPQPWSNYWGADRDNGATVDNTKKLTAVPLMTMVITPDDNAPGSQFPFMRIMYLKESARVSQIVYGNVSAWDQDLADEFLGQICDADPGSATPGPTLFNVLNQMNGGLVTYVPVEWPLMANCGAFGDLELSYTLSSLMVTRSDAGGNTKTYQIDTAGRVKTVIERPGRIWGGTGALDQFTWDSQSQVPEPELPCEEKCAWVQVFEYNDQGQVLHHYRASGNAEKNLYDERGNLTHRWVYPRHTVTESTRIDLLVEDPDRTFLVFLPDGEPILQQWSFYDPIYSTLIKSIDPRDAGAGGNAQYGANLPGRFTTVHILDYQENQLGYPPVIVQLMNTFGLPDPRQFLSMGLGEQNGDGGQLKGAGDVIRSIFPSPTHPNAAENPNEALPVTTEYSYHTDGLPEYAVDAEGIVTRYSYTNVASGRGYLQSIVVNSDSQSPIPGKTISRPNDPEASQQETQYEYDVYGNTTQVTQILDATTTRATTLQFNELNQVYREIGPAPFSYEKIIHYDANDKISLEEFAYGQSGFDGAPAAPSSFVPIASATGTVLGDSPLTIAIGYKYDFSGMIHEKKEGYRDSGGALVWERVERSWYNNDQKLIRFVNAEGQSTDYEYNSRDLLRRKSVGTPLTADPATPPPPPDHLGTDISPFEPGPDISVYRYGYDDNKNLICETDATSQAGGDNTTYFEYDDYDRLVETTRRSGSSETLDYDEASLVIKKKVFGDYVLPGGATGSPSSVLSGGLLSEFGYVFDELGREVRVEQAIFAPDQPENIVPTGLAQTDVFYDRNGAAVKKIDPRGHPTFSEYDRLGRLRRTATAPTPTGGNDPFEASWVTVRQHYDLWGRLLESVTTERRGDGSVDQTLIQTTEYDRLDRAIRVVNALGQAVRSRYDSLGRAVAVTDARGPVTGETIERVSTSATVSVNSHGNRVDRVWDTLGRVARAVRTMTGDGEGTGVEAPPGVVRDFDGTVGGIPQVGVPVHGTEIITITQYNRLDLPTTRTDDKGNITTYEYDNLSRPTQVIHPDNTTEEYTYDADGLVLTYTDGNGTVLTHTYDEGHRRTQTTVAVGLSGNAQRNGETLQFQYDGLDREIWSEDSNATGTADDHQVSKVYDSLGRLIEERQDDKLTLSQYDELGNKTDCTYAGGTHVAVTFDALNRVDTISDCTSAQSPRTVATYTYAGAGRVVARDSVTSGIGSTFEYDAGNRFIGLQHADGPTTLLEYAYHYNRANHRTYEVREHESPALGDGWEYDSAGRLLRETRDGEWCAPEPCLAGGTLEEHWLDGVGNRRFTQTDDDDAFENTVNERNGYDEYEGDTVTHDAAGNRATTGSRTYLYDGFHRLVEVQEGAQVIAEYEYFADGRRARKTLDGGSTVRDYAYDGKRIVEVWHGASVAQHFVYGQSTYRVLEYVDDGAAGAPVYTLLEDGRGSAVGLVDDSGALVERYRYTAYGEVTFQDGTGVDLGVTESPVGNPFLYMSYFWDEEVEHYWLRARVYDPRMGRFLVVDPIGVWGDEANLGNGYGYAGGNPIAFQDPHGLAHTAVGNLGHEQYMREWRAEASAKIARGEARAADLRDDIEFYDAVETASGTVAGLTLGFADGATGGLVSKATGMAFDAVGGEGTFARVSGNAGYQATHDAAELAGSIAAPAGRLGTALEVSASVASGGGVVQVGVDLMGGKVVEAVGAGVKKLAQRLGPAKAPKEVTVSRSRHPESAQHIEDAQGAGHPSELTVARPGADANRRAAQAGQERVEGMQLDEYPPAFTAEGGAGASVRPVTPSDNMGAGASIGNQTRKVKDGEKIKIVVGD